MDNVKKLNTLEEVKAFSDPYRLEILNCFYRLERPLTVKQVADQIGDTPAKVHYHVKMMEKAELLVLVYTEEVNGIIAKYYEPTARLFSIDKDDHSETISNLILNQSQKLVANIFHNNRKIFLKQMEYKKSNNVFSDGYVYLTEEEFKGFMDYFREFYDQHKNPDTTENDPKREKYRFFIAGGNQGREDE